jgi:hypothetical protein
MEDIMRIISGHQPNFAPHSGFFKKMERSDVFVLYDTMQVSTGDDAWQVEQKILGWDGEMRLKVPISDSNRSFAQTRIKETSRMAQGQLSWRDYHLMMLAVSYGADYGWEPADERELVRHNLEGRIKAGTGACGKKSADFFRKYYPLIQEIYQGRQESLYEFNRDLIKFLVEAFGIHTKIVPSGTIDYCVDGIGQTDRLIAERGIGECRDIVSSAILWLREKSRAPSFEVPLDKAVEMVIDEYDKTERGLIKNTEGLQKKIKFLATARIIRLCQIFGCDVHLSGAGARNYALESLYPIMGITNEYVKHRPEPYPQVNSDKFVPYLGAFDYLFNIGRLP